MSTIVAGRFDTQEAATAAIDALERAGFARGDAQSFYVTPRGMRGNVPIVDNEQREVGTSHAGEKAVKGALVGGAVGLAAGVGAAPLAVPGALAAGVIAGAGVGAYTSSLGGAVTGSGGGRIEEKAERGEPIERGSGMFVAVNADALGSDKAVQALRDAGAQDIERANGEW